MIFKQLGKCYVEDYRRAAKIFFSVLVMLIVCSCGLPHDDLINDVSDLARSGQLFSPNEVEYSLGQKLIKKNEREPKLATTFEVAQNSPLAKTGLRFVVATGSGLNPIDRRAMLSFDHLERYRCFLFDDVKSRFDRYFASIVSPNANDNAWRAQESSEIDTLVFAQQPKLPSRCLESLYLLSRLVSKGN